MITSNTTRLLVVDDEESIRHAIASFFEDFDYEVETATNGETGLSLFRRIQPDAVLTDLRMPGLNGWDLISIINEEAPDTPIIAISGAGLLDLALDAVRKGAWDYVTKPIVDLGELEVTLHRALERARLIRENKAYQENLEVLVRERTMALEDRTAQLAESNRALREEMDQRVAAQEQAAKLETRLRQAQKLEAIGTLAGGIAHDFNNILFGAGGFTEMALESVPDGSKAATCLQQIQIAHERAKKLVQQILTFSRETPAQPERINVAPVAIEALDLIRSTLPSDISVLSKIDEEAGEILADSTQIHQVIMNLCTNSYHAMRDRGGTLEVSIDRVRAGDLDEAHVAPGRTEFIRLKVTDSGHGMDEETLKRIFDPYFTTKTAGEGTGLGLATVHGIVMGHDGTVSVSSEPGKGTTFEVLFPVAESVSEIADVDRSRRSISSFETVLLLSDEPKLTELMELALPRLGYNVEAVAHADAACSKIEQNPEAYDVVVADSPPGDHRKRLLERIHSTRPSLPIVLCTDRGGTMASRESELPGVKEFVQKPYGIGKLLASIRRALDLTGADVEGEER